MIKQIKIIIIIVNKIKFQIIIFLNKMEEIYLIHIIKLIIIII